MRPVATDPPSLRNDIRRGGLGGGGVPPISDGDLARALLHAPGATHAVARLSRFGTLRDDERAVLEDATTNERRVEQREVVYERDGAATAPLLVLGGALREYFIDAEGRIQTVAVRLPGDLVGTEALWSGRHGFDLTALTPSRVAPALFLTGKDARAARLARVFGVLQLVEEAMLKDRVRLLGRGRAEERLLHLFVEMNRRQRALVDGVGDRAWMPLSQTEIANATGLTNVYVSKTMTRLRERAVIAVDGDIVTLADPEETATDVDFVDHFERAREPLAMPAG